MRNCDACQVKIDTTREFCPLCGEPLDGKAQMPANAYPNLTTRLARYDLVRRILLFCSLLVCGLSVLLNLLFTPSFLWCLIVIASILYAWLSIPPLLRRGVNFAARAVFTVVLTSALAISLDLIIGYRGWSVDFVVPSLLIAGIAAIGLMMVFNRMGRAQFVLYQILICMFGFVPLALYLIGWGGNLVMMLVVSALALAGLLATIVFGDRTVKSEFKRRFHF